MAQSLAGGRLVLAFLNDWAVSVGSTGLMSYELMMMYSPIHPEFRKPAVTLHRKFAISQVPPATGPPVPLP